MIFKDPKPKSMAGLAPWPSLTRWWRMHRRVINMMQPGVASMGLVIYKMNRYSYNHIVFGINLGCFLVYTWGPYDLPRQGMRLCWSSTISVEASQLSCVGNGAHVYIIYIHAWISLKKNILGIWECHCWTLSSHLAQAKNKPGLNLGSLTPWPRQWRKRGRKRRRWGEELLDNNLQFGGSYENLSQPNSCNHLGWYMKLIFGWT